MKPAAIVKPRVRPPDWPSWPTVLVRLSPPTKEVAAAVVAVA